MLLRLLVPASLAFLLLVTGTLRAETAPHWVWPREAGAGQPVLRRSFAIDQAIPAARLKVAADFCRATVTLNGQILTSVEPYSQTVEIDATRAIRRGENELVVEVEAVPGPAAIAISLTLTAADGKATDIVTDEAWLLGPEKKSGQIASSGEVVPELWGIGRRSIALDSFENYEQWRQSVSSDKAKAKQPRFWLAPGFEITTLRTAEPEEGSWIAMAFDPQGRLTVSREDQGLLRFTLDKDRTKVTQVETINKDLQECRGLLYDAHVSNGRNVLFANANNSKGFYRLWDSEKNDQFAEVTQLRQLPGGVGHGRNDLTYSHSALVPSILSIHGDSVEIPTTDTFDLTSPLREARRGQKTSEGSLVAMQPGQKSVVVVAAGLRNPYGVSVNEQRDAFTYDADAEHDMGTPWYRPTRILMLAPGADFGWRGVTGKWPPYYPDRPDFCPPILDTGRGSPTAVLFGQGAKFPPEYERALFALDWAYGRVLAIHLTPRGAGYRASAETFLQGRPLNVTDLAIGPDGAMYLLTGGRKTQSSLYRVSFTGVPPQARARSPHESACLAHAETARKARLAPVYQIAWQSWLPRPKESPIPPDLPDSLLGSPDPFLAYAARWDLEQRPLAQWQLRVVAHDDPAALLSGGLSLARTGDKTGCDKLLDRVVALPAEKLHVGQLLSLIHIYALAREIAPDEVAARKEKIVAQLDGLFPLPPKLAVAVSPLGTGEQAQRELARLLVDLEAPGIVERVAKTLLPPVADAQGSSSTAQGSRPVPQEDRIHALLILRHVRTGWTPATRKAYFETLRDAGSFVAGEGMPKFLAHFREEGTATLTEEERRELGDLLKPEAPPEEAALPAARPLVKAWTLEELQPLWADNEKQGDATRGQALFREALCVRCHRAGARGPAVGPDLTFVAGRFSRKDLLASMLTPSQVVAENYRNVEVTTTDGRVLIGRVVVGGDYRSETLRLATDPLHPTKIVELSKRDLETTRESPTSPMPEGLLHTLTKEEILDLLTFLERGK